jgi:hypothetical protein
MEEAGYRVVVRDVTTRALAVSQAKPSGAELVTVKAPEGRDVKGMNQPAYGSISLGLKLRSDEGDNLVPLLSPMRSVVVRHQDVRHT